MPALVHDVCWLVRGVDPLQQGVQGVQGVPGVASSGSAGVGSSGSDIDNSGASASGSGGSSGSGSGSGDATTTTTSSPRPQFVCLKDPVDFRSHPVSALVTAIIDRLVEKYTLSTHPFNKHTS